MGVKSRWMALCAGAAAGVSHAGLVVTYSFSALSSYPVAGIDSVEGSFTLKTNHYFTAPQSWVSAGSLSSCSVLDAACGSMGFAANAWGKNRWDRVDFGIRNTPDGSALTVNYYFALGALQTLGTHDSILLGSSQAARLTVSATPVAETVSEPAWPKECLDTPYGQPPAAWCGGIPYGRAPAVPDDDTGAGGPWGGGEPVPGEGPPINHAIPEPSTAALLLAGLALLAASSRRSRRS